MKGILMIPKDINDTHIEAAAKEIDLNGVPIRRGSRKYLVQIGTALYPPKYLISIATKYLTGKELDPLDFIAPEANAYLEKLGYKIVSK